MYKILIKACSEPDRARQIAAELSRWSGKDFKEIYEIVLVRDICINKSVDEKKAIHLKKTFLELGADAVMLAVNSPVVLVKQQVGKIQNSDDDDEVDSGRVLTEEEFTKKINERNDLFILESDSRLKYTEMAALTLALVFGMYFSTREIVVAVNSDFIERVISENTVRVVPSIDNPTRKKADQKNLEKDRALEKTNVKSIKKNQNTQTGSRGGGGNPRSHVTNKGVLGILTGQIIGKTVQSADIFGKGGFASDIDAIISGVGGLKTGGSPGVGRKGADGIGYGVGFESGFGGGGTNGIDDLIGSYAQADLRTLLTQREQRGVISLDIDPRGHAVVGGRSKTGIMRVVMTNVAALRHAYNRRLREKPGLSGKITVKFAIDEFGKVLFAQVVESTINDANLELSITEKIKRWVFDKIDKPGDVTEVVYPFAFSQ
jgi:hypothetical protein